MAFFCLSKFFFVGEYCGKNHISASLQRKYNQNRPFSCVFISYPPESAFYTSDMTSIVWTSARIMNIASESAKNVENVIFASFLMIFSALKNRLFSTFLMFYGTESQFGAPNMAFQGQTRPGNSNIGSKNAKTCKKPFLRWKNLQFSAHRVILKNPVFSTCFFLRKWWNCLLSGTGWCLNACF